MQKELSTYVFPKIRQHLGISGVWKVICEQPQKVTLNTYPRKQACKDFGVSYTVFKRVVSGVWQKGGSYYERQEQKQEEGEDKVTKGRCKSLNPVDVALAKKRKVTLSADMAGCKYCGKSYCSSKKTIRAHQLRAHR